ncbi:MAG: LysM peptidoglycan-binding domain-containing protein [Bacilli bacterium]|nr:LysM peptidoglycan-binding domain-containing protein [Bacilli bacterium]
MENKKRIKAIKFGIHSLTALSGAYLMTNFILESMSNKVAQSNDGTAENSIGYEEINILNNKLVNTNNFVILKVNKNDNVAVLKEKIEFCKKHEISIGLILETDSINLAGLYEDVDFLQAIVKEYKIDLPVYCDIDSLMSNKALNVAQRRELMTAFIDKMSRSDMYFGFYGKDSSLCECKEYVLDTTPYDCFVVKESENIKYDGTSNLKKELNGEITASQDLSKVIMSKGFNNSNKLIYTALYEVKENENYHSLALKYGLSEQDLREYNENQKEELKQGDIIKIPNIYKTVDIQKNQSAYNYAVARGIDISNYQINIDWNRVKETSDFVIVEIARDSANYSSHKGHYIEESIEQIKNTIENDIELGLYFCIAKDMKISVYEERLNEYFKKLNEELEKNNIVLERENIPVFLDFEQYYEHNDYYRLMQTFENVCKSHGFTKVGIYANGYTLQMISQSLEKDGEHIELKDTNWRVWKAGGPQYSGNENNDTGVTIDELIELKNESNAYYTPSILQITNVCKDTGASNDYGNCDVNFCYAEDLFGNNSQEEYASLQYATIDLEHYKGKNIKNIVDTIMNQLLLLGIMIVTLEIVGKRIIIGMRKRNIEKEQIYKKELKR